MLIVSVEDGAGGVMLTPNSMLVAFILQVLRSVWSWPFSMKSHEPQMKEEVAPYTMYTSSRKFYVIFLLKPTPKAPEASTAGVPQFMPVPEGTCARLGQQGYIFAGVKPTYLVYALISNEWVLR
jgi:hypothetical protein